ncbi:hypothetical protein ZOSMA_86G00530 [Zostera marina]|uniref:Uncharacterized protein n=1 Tax=Zostera marina TaxID=29655 RepID=A0A0K9NMV6_ZOSMR|nr:hypothetical protein ZOSMA_86G00530 [Zostera marina]
MYSFFFFSSHRSPELLQPIAFLTFFIQLSPPRRFNKNNRFDNLRNIKYIGLRNNRQNRFFDCLSDSFFNNFKDMRCYDMTYRYVLNQIFVEIVRRGHFGTSFTSSGTITTTISGTTSSLVNFSVR